LNEIVKILNVARKLVVRTLATAGLIDKMESKDFQNKKMNTILVHKQSIVTSGTTGNNQRGLVTNYEMLVLNR